jgi:hypothetical protein
MCIFIFLGKAVHCLGDQLWSCIPLLNSTRQCPININCVLLSKSPKKSIQLLIPSPSSLALVDLLLQLPLLLQLVKSLNCPSPLNGPRIFPWTSRVKLCIVERTLCPPQPYHGELAVGHSLWSLCSM